MNRSLVSILTVCGSLFAAFLITWFYLHGKAETKPVKAPFEHPFTKLAHKDGRAILFLRASKPEDVTALKSESSKFNVGLWLDVRLGGENQLVVSPGELIPSGPLKGKPIEIATRAECKDAGLFEAGEFADGIRDRAVIFNLISRRPGLSNKILEVWQSSQDASAEKKSGEKLFAVESVAIQSESDGTLKELRDAQPRGFYGSSQATLIQMEVLSNINLQGLMDLKSDMLVSSTEEMKRDGVSIPRVRKATLDEAHRRGLKRYAGPARTVEAAEELLKLGYDGVLIENRAVLDSLLR